MLDSYLSMFTKDGKPESRPILYTRVPSLEELTLEAVASKLLLPGTVRGRDGTRYKKPWAQDDWDCSAHRNDRPGGCYTMEIGGWRDGDRRGRAVFWHAIVCKDEIVPRCGSKSHGSLCARENPSGLWVSVLRCPGGGGGEPKVEETQLAQCWPAGENGSGPLYFMSCGPGPVLRTYAYLVTNPESIGLTDRDAPLLGDFF